MVISALNSRSISIGYVCSTCARCLRQTSANKRTTRRNLTTTIHNALAYRWDTLAPSPSQLLYADTFFLARPPRLLWSAAKFRTIGFGSLPEVAFLGRSNVGKSSLLNAVLQRKISYTSSKPGRTRTMNAFGVGGEDGRGNEARLVVLDMPGYGKGSREEWGREIMKYLVGRRELRRAFLLVDAEHGVKRSDEQLLAMLRQNAIPHQILLSKVDKILLPGSKFPSENALAHNYSKLKRIFEKIRDTVQPEARDGPPALGEILTCSAEKSIGRGIKLGINGIRWAILSAVGLENPHSAPPKIEVREEQSQSLDNP
ncbi:GTP-binding protein [Acarospora aff. strigata]|nr:GTP-binding protein [Acarospora aff. strigata]